ncbi:hypothetical protein ACLKA7_005065 [Drosophila subpalustris]
MEELLRAEEEIINSPPKAEPAEKDDKVRLSGGAWKRLAHYQAKGVPLEQARAQTPQLSQSASTTQVKEVSQELPCCSNSIAPSSNTPEEKREIAAGTTSAKAAKVLPALYGRLPTKPGKGARRSQEETVLLGSNRGKKRAARGRRSDPKML